MEALIAEPTTCHVHNCTAAADSLCASCKQLYCSHHVRVLSIQRRGERVEMRGHRGMLERVPTQTETYTLCERCGRKPIHILP